MNIGYSIAKLNDKSTNEDSILCLENCVAVSDGAGGCGLYADEWSKELISRLPVNKPICSFQELDEWIDGFWEFYYNLHETKAKQGDGILLNKFYNEGSCATLAAIWEIDENIYKWIAYGDSVAFHYNFQNGILEHSFSKLADFSNPPHLISCKDPIDGDGFKSGTFITEEHSLIFVASDALSHYILMMYYLSKDEDYKLELESILSHQTSNANLLSVAMQSKVDFKEHLISPLLESMESENSFRNYISELVESNVLDKDDYTISFLK